jgi:cytoskeleton-associated protein 5
MKEHKNPKVLSEGLLWMVSAVEDFGISNLKMKVRFPLHVCTLLSVLIHLCSYYSLSLQDMIGFCKDTGLQSSAAATRNATIKLIGMLHKFVGPGYFLLCNSVMLINAQCLFLRLTVLQISKAF